MIIRRGVRPRRYTVVDNETIEDASLSWEARGLLIYLLSKPDNWRINRDHLATQAPNGVAMVRRIMTELEGAGYLVRERVQGESGRIEWESTVYESPAHTIGLFSTGGPASGGSATDGSATDGSSTGGEPAVIVKTEATSTEKQAPEESSAPSGARTKGTRLAEQFVVTSEMREWAAAEVPDVNVNDQTKRFCDYWRAQSGAKGVKLDWIATWRNWMRKAGDDVAARRGRGRRDTLAQVHDLTFDEQGNLREGCG